MDQRTLNLAFRHARLAMALGTPDGCWSHVNAAMGRLLGAQPDELLGDQFWSCWRAEEAAEEREWLPAIASGRVPIRQVERSLRGPGGRPIEVVIAVGTLTWRADTADATLLWQMQPRSGERRSRPPSPDDRMITVEGLVTRLSHEMNSPLTSLLAHLRLASDELGATTGLDELEELLAECESAATRLGAIVQRMRSSTSHGAAPRGAVPQSEPAVLGAVACPRRRTRVLAVDDDTSVTRAIRRLLRAEHEVDTAASGHEALAQLRRDPDYDLILCDLMMPGVSGRDVWETLARRQPELIARLVLMTGAALSDEARWLRQVSCGTLLEKPFDSRTLRELVRRVTGRPDAHRSSGGS